jgi:Flp pilus assembly protein TadG
MEATRLAMRLSVAIRRFAADGSGATAIEYGILTLSSPSPSWR